MIQGDLLRDEGIERVGSHNREWLEWARMKAFSTLQTFKTVSSDDIRSYVEDGDYWPDHPNTWGAIFKDKRFEPCGWKKSNVPSNHSRYIRVWRLK